MGRRRQRSDMLVIVVVCVLFKQIVNADTTDLRCNGIDNGCCTADQPCNDGDGDCDSDSECAGDLVCGKDNCPWGDNDDCCMEDPNAGGGCDDIVYGYSVTYKSTNQIDDIFFTMHGVRTTPLMASSTHQGCTITQPGACNGGPTSPWDESGDADNTGCWSFGTHSILCDHAITSDEIHIHFWDHGHSSTQGFTVVSLTKGGGEIGVVYDVGLRNGLDAVGKLCHATSAIDGGWSDWSEYTACSAQCLGGQRTRTRSCSNPRPQHNGQNCTGDTSETQECNKQPCVYVSDGQGISHYLYDNILQFDVANFNDAKTFCESQGSHLPIVDNESTMNMVADQGVTVWLGAEYDSQLGKSFWFDGQPVQGAHWADEGASGNEICMTARKDGWYHSSCSETHKVLCQRGAPNPVSPSVNYELTENRIRFKCEIERKNMTVPVISSVYEVAWYLTRANEEPKLVRSQTLINGHISFLYQDESNDLLALGYEIHCNVRTWYSHETVKSEYTSSNKLYAGLQFQPSTVQITEGKSPVTISARFTVPMLCKDDSQSCNVSIALPAPSSDVIVKPCHVIFQSNELLTWKNISLAARRDVVDNGETTRVLSPTVTSHMWNNHTKINVQVRRMSVSTGRCTSTGDPHYRTFDGHYFDHYHVGDYVLVQSKARNFQVHVRTQKCARVSCNCGIVVREGDDVLSINMCGSYSSPDVRYLSNREPQRGTRIEQSANGKTFILKFASTAFVRFSARPWSNTFYADVTVQLPADDFNNTIGLCGNMDKMRDNDMMDREGVIRNGCGRQACTAFTESWKIPTNESLFCYHGGQSTCLQMKTNEETAKEENMQCGEDENVVESDDKVTKGFRQMVFPGQLECKERRGKSSTPDDVIVLPEGTSDVICGHQDDVTYTPVVPSFPTESGITESIAMTWCESEMKGSQVYTVCSGEMGAVLPLNDFIKQCVEDIKILDDKVVGLQSAMEAMKSLCEDVVMKNPTNDYQHLTESLCPNECSSQGTCENGTCLCNEGFATEDCSVSTNQIPELIVVPFTTCDVRKSHCSKIQVESSHLVPGNIVCNVSGEGESSTVTPAELLNFAKVACRLPGRNPDNTNRYLSKKNGIPMEKFTISLSNNGKNFSTYQLPVVVYDSKCMMCSGSNNGTAHCKLKENTCLIGGYCFNDGEKDPENPQCKVCDASRSTNMFLIVKDNQDESCRDHRSFELDCKRESMTATWETAVFMNNAPLAVTFRDVNCHTFNQNVTHTWISTLFTECGTDIIEHDNVITQQNEATVTVFYGNEHIQRKTTYVYGLKCIFDRDLRVMTANTFMATDRNHVVAGNATSAFAASIAQYASSSFLQILDADPVPVASFEPMFFGVRSQNENPGLKFVVHQCYASPSTRSPGVLDYVFFDMKCPIDHTFKIIDSSNDHFNFEMEAFNFIRVRKSIRIHCKLLVCKSNSTAEDCQQTCQQRRRRDVALRPIRRDVEVVEEIDVETVEIIYQKKRTCEETVCPADATCWELYPAQCRCNDGFVEVLDKGECRKNRMFEMRGLHIEKEYLDSYDDPSSTDYRRLVAKMERDLVTSLKLTQAIEGLKIVHVRRGSVIVDLAVLHADTVTQQQAFEVVLEATMNYARTYDANNNTKGPRIKADMIPTLVAEKVVANDGMKTVLSIGGGVVACGVVVLVVSMVIYRRLCGRPAAKTLQVDGKQNFGMDVQEVQA